MVLRSKYLVAIRARRVLTVLILFFAFETLIHAVDAQHSRDPQTQSFRLSDLSALSLAYAKDDEGLRARREQQQKARRAQRKQREKARQARREQQRKARRAQREQRQKARQARREQQRKARQAKREQRQKARQARREQQQKARQAKRKQQRKASQAKRKQQQKTRHAQRKQRPQEKASQAKRKQRPQEQHQARRDTRQEKPKPDRVSAQELGPGEQNDTSEQAETGTTEQKPASSTAQSVSGQHRDEIDIADDIVDDPPGFDAMDPPDTLAEFVKQLGNSKTPSPSPTTTLGNPHRPASSLGALFAPSEPAPPVTQPEKLPAVAEIRPAALAPTAAPPKPKARAVTTKRGRSMHRSEFLAPELPRIAPRELLATNVAPATLKSALANGFKVASSQSYSGLGLSVTRLIVPAGMSAERARSMLQSDLREGSVGFNHTYRLYRTATGTSETLEPPADTKNACTSGDCSGKSAIGWTSKLESCATGIKIGVVDTGIDPQHPAFSGRRIEFATTVSNNKPLSSNSHGTGILALLAGGPKSDVRGLLPNASYVISDVFFKDHDGFPVTDTISLLNALELMGKLGVAVVNLSLAGPKDPLIEKAIVKLSRNGMIFVAAAGNGGPSARPRYPAAYAQVIAVTAVAKNMRAFRYANHGDYIDVAAPGVRVWTARPGRKYGYQSGTSFAVPYVTAAVAAIYRSLPARTRAAVLDRLSVQDLGVPGKDKIYGKGLMVAPHDCAPSAISWSTSVRPEPFTGTADSQLVSR